jgi:hypothetical protein
VQSVIKVGSDKPFIQLDFFEQDIWAFRPRIQQHLWAGCYLPNNAHEQLELALSACDLICSSK